MCCSTVSLAPEQGRITTGDAQKLMRRLDRRCAALLGRQ
jgi:hypothetical protein